MVKFPHMLFLICWGFYGLKDENQHCCKFVLPHCHIVNRVKGNFVFFLHRNNFFIFFIGSVWIRGADLDSVWSVFFLVRFWSRIWISSDPDPIFRMLGFSLVLVCSKISSSVLLIEYKYHKVYFSTWGSIHPDSQSWF